MGIGECGGSVDEAGGAVVGAPRRVLASRGLTAAARARLFGRRVGCTDKQGGAASLAPPNSKVNKGSGNNSFGLQIFVVPPAHRGVRPLCLRVLQKETLHLTFHVNFCLGGGSAQRT